MGLGLNMSGLLTPWETAYSGTHGAYLLVSPFAEVDRVGRQAKLLADSPLEVHRLRLQGAVLRKVAAGRQGPSITLSPGQGWAHTSQDPIQTLFIIIIIL
jgi:hypothetical protein